MVPWEQPLAAVRPGRRAGTCRRPNFSRPLRSSSWSICPDLSASKASKGENHGKLNQFPMESDGKNMENDGK